MKKRSLIPRLAIPSTVKPYLLQLLHILIEHGELKNFRPYIDYPYNKRQRVARLIIIITTEVDELVDNLNLALDEMIKLPESHKYSRIEKLHRFRSFLRLYAYEFGRSEDIYTQFLGVLRSWKILNREQVREFRSVYHKEHGHMVVFRNMVIHSLADWTGSWDELSMLAHSRSASEHDEFTLKFDKHVKKITKELISSGKRLSSFFQTVVVKALALFIRKYELESKETRQRLKAPNALSANSHLST